ncbi:hypothetical protein ACWCQL_18045 [Streptomyces sp. NPDC002073]
MPAFKPATGQSAVDICWQHTDANGTFDSAASVAAASRLVTALGIDRTNKVAPSLHTLHTPRLAIDMTTTWTAPSITITDKTGTRVKITTTPRTGLNTKLIAVGKTYGVIHFLQAAKDKNHWSSTGRRAPVSPTTAPGPSPRRASCHRARGRRVRRPAAPGGAP